VTTLWASSRQRKPEALALPIFHDLPALRPCGYISRTRNLDQWSLTLVTSETDRPSSQPERNKPNLDSPNSISETIPSAEVKRRAQGHRDGEGSACSESATPFGERGPPSQGPRACADAIAHAACGGFRNTLVSFVIPADVGQRSKSPLLP